MKIPILGNHHKIEFPMDRSHSKHVRIEYIQGIQIYPQNYHHNGLDIDGDQDNDNITDWVEEIATDNWAWFTRGYTGHACAERSRSKMLPEFGLINMPVQSEVEVNGRLYDPLLARMLSPDNYVQDPENPQSYNRYSYVWNNPLKYVDPDGEYVTKYIDEDGNELANTNDGSDDIITISNDYKEEFNELISLTSEGALKSLVFNNVIKVKVLGSAGFDQLDKFTTQWSRQKAINYLQDPSISNATMMSLSESLSAWTDPQQLLAAASMLALRPRVRFSRRISRSAAKGVTVLGKYPDYINLASTLNARRFNIPSNIWNKMTSVEQWAANVKFLDRTISRGDVIRLSNPVKDLNKVSGYFRKELDYLISNGYRLNSSGTQLVR